jgi:hypothetical protein
MARPVLFSVLLASLLLGPMASAQEVEEDEGAPRRYGDAGTSEASVLLGVSSEGMAFGGGFRHFFIDAIAPGLEAAVYRENGVTQGFTFGSLRVVPLRFEQFALVLTGRAGRVFLSEHGDGWAYGGDAGIIMFFSRHVGLELGYEILRLAPDSFCADLTTCTLQRPVLSLRFTF